MGDRDRDRARDLKLEKSENEGKVQDTISAGSPPLTLDVSDAVFSLYG